MNFGTPVPLLIGIILILGALALFFLEKFRPGYERDSDKVYAVLLLVSGLFLLAHLDMELLASFQQLLMAGMLTALLIESIRNRLPRTEQAPPIDSRPPRPRYDNRPPSRRVYRAELDDRGMPLRDRPYAAPRMAPAPDPRMAAARDDYRRNDYSSERPRQPYEEFRGPAGRLQPSDEGEFRNDRYADGNGRYGERPPARPADRPSERPSRPPQNNPQGNLQSNPRRDLERESERYSGGPPENFQSRPAERPPERPPENTSGPDQRSDFRDRPANGERALNVRPYSEAPKVDLPGDEYRPPNRPEGAPS
ncbi:MAG: Ycf66 family protein [Phormidesmis sp.]